MSFGQKPFKLINSALKKNKPTEALKVVMQSEKDTTFVEVAQLLLYGMEASLMQHEQENEKIYLKQKTDTAQFFKSLHNVFDYALRAEQAAVSQHYKKAKLQRLRKQIAAQLNLLYPNLNAATLYYMQKHNWSMVSQLSRLAILTSQSELFSQTVPPITLAELANYAYRHLFANFLAGNYVEVDQFFVLADLDTLHRERSYKMMAQAYQYQQKDTLYYEMLHKGLVNYPQNMYFFTNIANHQIYLKQYQSLLQLIDTLLLQDKNNMTLYEYQAKTNLLLGEDSLCIVAAQRLKELGDTMAISDYYIGQSYFNLAHRIELPLSIKAPGYKSAFAKRQEYYVRSKPHIESYRQKHPEAKEVWAPILYEIYLKLNLGKEFEEILKHQIDS